MIIINVMKKEVEKNLKYTAFAIEIQRMWNVQTEVIPVIIGATGTICESFRKYFSNIPEKCDFKDLQKTDTLGTAHAHTHTLSLSLSLSLESGSVKAQNIQRGM
jgi:hypothetical protein